MTNDSTTSVTAFRRVKTLDEERARLRGRRKVNGVGRVDDNDKALLLMLSWRPSDDQLRYLHEVMERAVTCMPEDLR